GQQRAVVRAVRGDQAVVVANPARGVDERAAPQVGEGAASGAQHGPRGAGVPQPGAGARVDVELGVAAGDGVDLDADGAEPEVALGPDAEQVHDLERARRRVTEAADEAEVAQGAGARLQSGGGGAVGEQPGFAALGGADAPG